MHGFTRNLLTEWRKLGLPFADKTFVVAISGGADSVSLALALHELRNRKKLNLRFVLAHFNHNLRGVDSMEDEKFVKELAATLEFELAVGVQHSESKIENQKGNLEQNARLARYEFLAEIAENLAANGILTAHTLNDQAETFLLNLIRGSGIDGLGGMKPIREFELKAQSSKPEVQIVSLNDEYKIDDDSKIQKPKSKMRLVRPLLNWAKREETENFCLLNEINYRHDSMNENLAFRRVRIRKVLIPLLMDFNPKIVQTIGKTTELLREHANLSAQRVNSVEIKSDTETEPESFSTKDGEEEIIEVLLVEDLKNLFPSMRRFVVREWLKNKRGDLRRLGAKHFGAVENLVLSRKSGQTIELPGGEIVIKKGGKLFYEKQQLKKIDGKLQSRIVFQKASTALLRTTKKWELSSNVRNENRKYTFYRDKQGKSYFWRLKIEF